MNAEETAFVERVAEMKRRRSIKKGALSSVITGMFCGTTFCWVVGVPFSWSYFGLLVGAAAIGMVLSYYPLIWLSRWLDKRAETNAKAEEEIMRRLEQDRDGLQLPDNVKEKVWRRLVAAHPEIEHMTIEVPDESR